MYLKILVLLSILFTIGNANQCTNPPTIALTVNLYDGANNPDLVCAKEGLMYDSQKRNWIAFAAGFNLTFFKSGRSFPRCFVNGNRLINAELTQSNGGLSWFIDNYVVNTINGTIVNAYESVWTGWSQAGSFSIQQNCLDWTCNNSSFSGGYYTIGSFTPWLGFWYTNGPYCYYKRHIHNVKNEL